MRMSRFMIVYHDRENQRPVQEKLSNQFIVVMILFALEDTMFKVEPGPIRLRISHSTAKAKPNFLVDNNQPRPSKRPSRNTAGIRKWALALGHRSDSQAIHFILVVGEESLCRDFVTVPRHHIKGFHNWQIELVDVSHPELSLVARSRE